MVRAIPENEVKQRCGRNLVPEHTSGPLQIDACDWESFEGSVTEDNLAIMAISIEDIEEALKEKLRIDLAERPPKIYHEFLYVFSRDEAERLPPYRPSDHQIILKPGTEPPWGPLYGMSREELMVMKKYIKENLEK
ncbi:hypothetical protein K3495_g10368 [Podosphaera aphanis]|nr:hypothetical protein K3495_g10368 [Podosphaera aphanis]